MNTQTYRFSRYEKCSRTGKECREGFRFVEHLQSCVTAAHATCDQNFEFSGKVRLSNCERECISGFHCCLKKIQFFGDIDPDEDVQELSSFLNSKEPALPKAGSKESNFSSPRLLERSKHPSALIQLERKITRLS